MTSTGGRRLSPFVPEGERILIAIRPSPWFILLRSLGLLAGLGAVGGLLVWTTGRLAPRLKTDLVIWVFVGIGAARLLWETLQWGARLYVLTDRRALRLAGVIRRYVAELPLSRLQHLTVFRSLAERITGVGTLGLATAGSGDVEMFWIMVPRPQALLAKVREAADRASGRSGAGPGSTVAEVPVIGLAGAIGSGKSEAARVLAELGCVVIDSDRAAREALERPEVREEIVRWWGSDVLTGEGQIDRKKVADIVFTRPAERERLERLVHPLVRARRAEERRRAEQAGAQAVVIDAPLLYEAGVDRECDAVLFIDAPAAARASRLRETRGWDEAEVARREAAQWGLEVKRSRATEVIANDGTRAELRTRVQAALERILSARREKVSGGGRMGEGLHSP